MRRRALVVVVGVLVAGAACAGAPSDLEVQGTYEGVWKAEKAEGKLEADVVALGDNAYKVYATQYVNDKPASKAELDGKAEGDKLVFAGKVGNVDWEGVYAPGEVRGRIGQDATFEIKRIVKEPPTLGKKPPEGAVALLDGKSFDNVTKRNKTEEWKLVGEGGVEVARGGIRTAGAFEGSFDAHIEFRCNFKPAARGQGRGNSGFYLPNGTEIQVLDSFGFAPDKGSCGALYGQKPPDVNASLPPMQWQTYDVEYRMKSKKGRKTGKPWVTVLHNGIKIHDDVELSRAPRNGGFHLQDHGNPVCYRNFWVLPVEEK